MLSSVNKCAGKKAKCAILPFFIPMEGCPYQCIYCDQCAISGHDQGPTAAAIAAAVSACVGPVEVAFYGGTFTALSEEQQHYYLQAVAPFLSDGRVTKVRVSTRPDSVDEPILERLRIAGVRTVELGVQSFADSVLKLSGRGYNGQTARKAAELVKKQGLALGVQLMTGLPGQSRAISLTDVQETINTGAEMVRIYPTLVLKNTPLAALYAANSYRPQTLIEAVTLCRDMVAMLEWSGLLLIRVGVNPGLALEKALIDGPYADNFGHLVKSSLAKEQLHLAMERANFVPLSLSVPRCDLPVVVGDHKTNKLWLNERLGRQVRWHGDDGIPTGAILLSAGQQQFLLTREEFLDFYVSKML